MNTPTYVSIPVNLRFELNPGANEKAIKELIKALNDNSFPICEIGETKSLELNAIGFIEAHSIPVARLIQGVDLWPKLDETPEIIPGEIV